MGRRVVSIVRWSATGGVVFLWTLTGMTAGLVGTADAANPFAFVDSMQGGSRQVSPVLRADHRQSVQVVAVTHKRDEERPLEELLKGPDEAAGQTQAAPGAPVTRQLKGVLLDYLAEVAGVNQAELEYQQQQERLRLDRLNPDPAVQKRVEEELAPYRQNWERRKRAVEQIRSQIHQEYNLPLFELQNAQSLYMKLDKLSRPPRAGTPEFFRERSLTPC